MNIGLNWYLSDNTSSMWTSARENPPDPDFIEMVNEKRKLVDAAERERKVREIAAYTGPARTLGGIFTRVFNVFSIARDCGKSCARS